MAALLTLILILGWTSAAWATGLIAIHAFRMLTEPPQYRGDQRSDLDEAFNTATEGE